MVVNAFNPTLRRPRQENLCEFKVHSQFQASQTYVVGPSLKKKSTFGIEV